MPECLDLAARLRTLADQVDDLDPARVAGELEALKTTIILTEHCHGDDVERRH